MQFKPKWTKKTPSSRHELEDRMDECWRMLKFMDVRGAHLTAPAPNYRWNTHLRSNVSLFYGSNGKQDLFYNDIRALEHDLDNALFVNIPEKLIALTKGVEIIIHEGRIKRWIHKHL